MKPTRKRPSKRRTPPRANSKPRPASSTADILGSARSKVAHARIPARWAAHHRHLLELRAQLLAQAGKLAREAAEGTPSFSMHMADAGTDSFDRDFALSILSADQDALYEIEAAINRIETGTYGICEMTGKPIPKGRLQAIPWARFSAASQRQLEREGTLKRRRFCALDAPPAEVLESENPEEAPDAADKE
jgi:DnaK suppressor protein